MKKFARIILYITLIAFVSVIFYLLGSRTTWQPFSIQLSRNDGMLILFSLAGAVADWIALFRKKKVVPEEKKTTGKSKK